MNNLFKKIKLKSLLFHVLVPMMLVFTIMMLIPDYKEFLGTINKPLELPDITFVIVWPILYVLMGISAYIVDQKEGNDINLAMKMYYLQLILNIIYPIVFFYLHSFVFGAIITLAILIILVHMMLRFYKINKVSFYLLIPYLLWMLIANYLQLGIYYLN